MPRSKYTLSDFKVGDRVRVVYHGPSYNGKEGVVQGFENEYVQVLVDGKSSANHWYSWRLEPVTISPFEEQVRDYIKSELSQ